MPTSDELLVVNLVKKYRHEELEGRPHLVANATMLGEAVVEGSEGAVFYPNDVIKESAEFWDAQPIVVYHPKLNGKFVSAKRPQFFNSRKIGTLFETNHNGNLQTECWFDEEKTKKVDERVYEAIINNQGMEVSTGLKVDWVPEEGEHNGKKYKKRAIKLKPDHLAILPDQIGAFSRAMGGGLFANMALEPESVQTVLSAAARIALARCGVEVVGNELSFSDVTRQIADLLATTYGQKGRYWRGWIEEVFPDYVVFHQEDGKCYKVGYSVSENEVSLSGTPKEVNRVTSYETITNALQEKEMAFDKATHINGLITNGIYEEGDREWLNTQGEDVLKKIKIPAKLTANTTVPPVATPPQVPPTVPPVVTPPAAPTKEVTVNEWMNDPSVPLPIRQAAQRQLAADANYKAQLVQTILTANEETGFTAEFLATKEIAELEGWAKMANKAVKPNEIPMYQSGFGGVYRGAAGMPPMVGNAGTGPAIETPLGVPDIDGIFANKSGK